MSDLLGVLLHGSILSAKVYRKPGWAFFLVGWLFPQSSGASRLLKLRCVCDAKNDRTLSMRGSFHWCFLLEPVRGTSEIDACKI